jgi:hypothetical protein
MTSKKMSETIKNVLEMTDSLLGRPATRGQVIQVIELIESFDEPNKAPKAVTQTATKKRKAKTHKSQQRYVQWSSAPAQNLFDEILDGDVSAIAYSDLDYVAPRWKKLARQSVRNRFNYEARKRGFNNVKLAFNDVAQTIFVRAIK